MCEVTRWGAEAPPLLPLKVVHFITRGNKGWPAFKGSTGYISTESGSS
jgi:hypothetical protein